ncbi:ABC transporter ATP-binding protein [candidate division CSSED10-310 bacterium]|uniref:ABC transporter ATP-binding protein n=1 Tax=candidate division CSSED10-310 bacterium TaxID=2855610 RepID=A0ABV6Z692_UNCC1
MPVIEIKNLVLKFGENTLLKNLNLTVDEGETVILCGPSGTGKSVILRLCVGLLRPTAGQIYIDGKDISALKEREMNHMRKNMGMLFQNYGLFDSMTVADNVGFFLIRHTTLSATKIREQVKEVLAQVNLENVEDLKPVELSGGMKKRVGIARAIVHDPKIVYYDEPTAGLDPVSADLINDLIIDMKKRYKVSSLSVSNEMNCAYKIGDRVGMLYQGELVALDTPENIKNSDNPIVHQFVNGLERGPIKML